jgi:hypothetical protein
MALGFKEAQIVGSLPKVEFTSDETVPVLATDQENVVIPFTPKSARNLFTPNDPLTGPTSPDDISGLVQSSNRVVEALEKLLIATRAQHPNMSIIVKGPTVLQANSGEKYTFDIGGKRVPSLNTFIQNNTPNVCYIGLEDSAGLTNIQVPANGGIVQIADVAVSWLSIWVTALTNINGVDNMGQPIAPVANPAVGILVMAWSNGEWDAVWGQTA